MARDGTGTYVPVGGTFTNGTVIDADVMMQKFNDMDNALTQSLSKDGQTVATGNLPMGNFHHTGVSDGTARDQYASVAQVQDSKATWCGTAGGTANARTIAPSPAITAYAAGQAFEFINGAATNTGATTLAVSGLATKAIVRESDNGALVGGEMSAGVKLRVVYDGTRFVLEQPSAPISPVGRVTALNTLVGAGLNIPGTSAQTYSYFALLFTAAGAHQGTVIAGTTPGGLTIDPGVPGNFWSGFATRVF